MNQSINTDSKNSKEPQQKYRLGTVSIKILGGLNRFYRRLTSPSASIMAQNIQLFGPRGGSNTASGSSPLQSTYEVMTLKCFSSGSFALLTFSHLNRSYLDVIHLYSSPNFEISYNNNDNLKICMCFGYNPLVNICHFLLRELRHFFGPR